MMIVRTENEVAYSIIGRFPATRISAYFHFRPILRNGRNSKERLIMLGQILLPIVFSGFFIAFGWLFKKRGNMHFIAGYETNFYRPKNEKRLVNRIGILIMLFGVETFVLMILHLFNAAWFSGLIYGILAIVHALVLLIFVVIDQLEG